MRNHFAMDAWLFHILCFGVQYTGFESEEVPNINLQIGQSKSMVKMMKKSEIAAGIEGMLKLLIPTELRSPNRASWYF